jgi:hypothetical protein
VAISIVNGAVKVDNANVVATDVMASNGIIHIIDSVILPSAAAPASAKKTVDSECVCVCVSVSVCVFGGKRH